MWRQLWAKKIFLANINSDTKNSSILWLVFSLYSILWLVERPTWRFVCWTSFFCYWKLEGTFRSPAKCSFVEVYSFFQHHRFGKCIKSCRPHKNLSFIGGVAHIVACKMVWNIQKWFQILLHSWIYSEGNYKFGSSWMWETIWVVESTS